MNDGRFTGMDPPSGGKPGEQENRRLECIAARSKSLIDRSLLRFDREKCSESASKLVYDPDKPPCTWPKSNRSGVAFNIINHAYQQTPDGARLKEQDQAVLFRTRLRGSLLAAKSHSCFDPITGVLKAHYIQQFSSVGLS